MLQVGHHRRPYVRAVIIQLNRVGNACRSICRLDSRGVEASNNILTRGYTAQDRLLAMLQTRVLRNSILGIN